jgi:hypothetical protein
VQEDTRHLVSWSCVLCLGPAHLKPNPNPNPNLMCRNKTPQRLHFIQRLFDDQLLTQDHRRTRQCKDKDKGKTRQDKTRQDKTRQEKDKTSDRISGRTPPTKTKANTLTLDQDRKTQTKTQDEQKSQKPNTKTITITLTLDRHQDPKANLNLIHHFIPFIL